MRATIEIEFNKFAAIASRMPNVVNDALNKAVLDVAEHADSNAPVDTGALRANKTLNYAGGGNHSSSVDWNMEYAPSVEYGRGAIFAKPGKFLVFEIDGQTIFAKSVGPAAPQPFAAPALDYAAPRLEKRLRSMEGGLV